jgi:hypothetical protein
MWNESVAIPNVWVAMFTVTKEDKSGYTALMRAPMVNPVAHNYRNSVLLALY